MVEFDVERERANGEKDEGDIGINQVIQNLFLQRHFKQRNGLPGEFERDVLSVEALETLAIHLMKKVLVAGGNVVDEVLREGLLLGKRLRLAHRALGDV